MTPEEGYAEAERRIADCAATGGRQLNLSWLALITLPDRLFDLTALTSLDLRGNKLQTLPDRLFDLTALTSLDLRGNKLQTLPDRIGDLTALTSLDLGGNHLQILPDRIGDLTALTSLDLDGNHLRTLPDRLGDLTALTSLDLDGNHLRTLPDRIGDLTALETLDLVGNSLRTLPDRIGDLTALETLDLSGNHLRTLPDRIGNLTALTSLDLDGNHLRTLPDRIGDLTALETLDLVGNSLRTLPDRIGDLTALTSLYLGGNDLQILPDRLGDLTALTSLDLYGNHLRTLPDRIGDLTALETLDLSGNHLRTLPDRIGNLTALTSLDLSHNQLNRLPEQLATMPALETVYLLGNPLRDPPAKVAEAGLPAIRNYFDMKKSGGGWVKRSTPISRAVNAAQANPEDRKTSVWAVTETAICIGLLMTAIAFEFAWPLLTGAAVAPLLLMRTNESIICGVERFAGLGRCLGIRSGDLEGKPLKLAGVILVMGIASLFIKPLTALQFGWRWQSFAAIPANLGRLVRETDLFYPPELVPGAEDNYATQRDGLLTMSDLRQNFAANPKYLHQILEYRMKNRLVSGIGFTFLGVFFLFAWLYRFSLKASCLIYWPFLLVHRFDDDAQIDRDATADKSAADWLKKTPATLAMAMLGGGALVGLLHHQGTAWAKPVANAIVGAMPGGTTDILAALPKITTPKLLLTSLLIFVLCYFATRAARAGMHRSYAITGKTERGDYVFWRNMFKFFAAAQNITAVAATAIVMVWAWPQVATRLGEVWAFLF